MSQRKYTKTLNFCICVVIRGLLQAALQRLAVSPRVTWGEAGILVHSAGTRDRWRGADMLCRNMQGFVIQGSGVKMLKASYCCDFSDLPLCGWGGAGVDNVDLI